MSNVFGAYANHYNLLNHDKDYAAEARNVVDVNFEVLITEKKSCSVSTVRELHCMRYLFLPEIPCHFKAVGLVTCCCHKWLSFDPPNADSWYLLSAGGKL